MRLCTRVKGRDARVGGSAQGRLNTATGSPLTKVSYSEESYVTYEWGFLGIPVMEFRGSSWGPPTVKFQAAGNLPDAFSWSWSSQIVTQLSLVSVFIWQRAMKLFILSHRVPVRNLRVNSCQNIENGKCSIANKGKN